ncbi:MAG TPA: mycofactocin system transcriptional regulator [Solirubrobacterales bacterium]|jgi:mycofactocin system transcriptional regulator|nr:mycofactocin system transcriptional regulator [Solirubrobacterales bacterium]
MSIGRPPTTTHEQIERIALGLFAERGFEETTVDEIAAAVGVGRRTIFRYFPSKNDMVWGEFGQVIERLRAHLAEGEDLPLMDALRRAAVLSNRYPVDQLPELRQRLTLITTAPSLQANSMLRYAAWRRAVAEWTAARLGLAPDDLVPEAISQAALGASMAAFTRWVGHPREDLGELLDRAYEVLGSGPPSPSAARGNERARR